MSLDAEQTLAVTESAPVEAEVVMPQVRPATSLSDHEIQAAMREVGLTHITVKKWRAQERLGSALEQIGAVRVCAGDYVISNHLRQEAIQLCRARLKKKNLSTEDFATLLKLLNDLVTSKDSANANLLKAVQSGMIKDDPELKAGQSMAPKGHKIQVVQINQTVTHPASEG